MEKIFRYDDVPILETTGGKLKGYYYDGAYIYKGVPYAQAKRFQMPEEITWEGVKEATSYGFVCPLLMQDTPSAELMVPHRFWAQNENCQNLNIWTKNHNPEKKMPVVVWLHGGGYFAGSSIEQVAYDGFRMCMDGDVVVVSINHRLNILGYLDLSPFGEKYANSGNAGHADMVAALKWIHNNIALFGGDPENVTIFGQSGGGMKVADLMQIPAADGLFHKGLIMSGVDDGNLLASGTGDGRKITEALLKELKLENAEELEKVPYYALANAYAKVSPALAAKGEYVGGAPIKNDYYAGLPLKEGFREHAYEIPLMIGSVFGEFSFMPAGFDKNALSEKEKHAVVERKYKEHSDMIIQEFVKAYPGKNITDLIFLDRAFRQPTKKLAHLHAEGKNAKAYLYNFTLEFPFQYGKIAWHCSDIPFFFKNTDKVEICAIPGVTEKLEGKIFGAFMTFVKTGVPGCEELPAWQEVTETDEPTMIFDRECELRHNYDDALYAAIDRVLPPFSMMDMGNQEVQH